MATLIKLTEAVNDPNNELPVLTDFGIVPGFIGAYYNRLKAAGYTPTLPERTAVSAFYNTLKTAGVIPKIKEVAPVIGNSLAAACVMMGQKAALTTPMAGATTIVSSDLNAGGFFQAPLPLVTANGKPLATGRKYADFRTGLGMTVYVKADNVVYNAAVVSRKLIGATIYSSPLQQFNLDFRVAVGDATNLIATHKAGVLTKAVTPTEKNKITAYRISATALSVTMSIDGVSAGAASTVDATTDDTRDIWLLCQNQIEPALGKQQFEGKLYGYICDDGTLSQSQQVTLNTAFNQLLSDLGRS